MVCGGFKGLGMWRKVRSCLGLLALTSGKRQIAAKPPNVASKNRLKPYRGHEFTGTH